MRSSNEPPPTSAFDPDDWSYEPTSGLWYSGEDGRFHTEPGGPPVPDDQARRANRRNAASGIRYRNRMFVVASRASQLLTWRRDHRFCGRCGGETELVERGSALGCTGCGMEHFPRVSPAVIVLVHDGARPLVSADLIKRCYQEIADHGAAIAAVPVKDTLKKEDGGRGVSVTVDRTGLWQAQTPQGGKKELLAKAFLLNGDEDVTDESSLFEKAGIPVRLVTGEVSNISTNGITSNRCGSEYL